jgi:dynein heavy chain
MERLLEDYGFDNKPMNLVLFNDALDHVTKIHRILRFPRGCGLLVGFGGSGKQSLTRLGTFVASYTTWTINLVRGYKEADFRADLQLLFREVVLKPKTFLLTDAHVVEEGFLELVNNILTIGMVPGLFPEEEKDGLIGPLDKEMRAMKLPETKEFRWQYFINRCRENMHIVMCMSPAGDTLRIRCRNFPGLVSNTCIDWFFPWPQDALSAVATYFLQKVQLPEEHRENVTKHIVMCHQSVQKFSIEFDATYKRKNYSTPKNYLDFIQNYMKFLNDKRKDCDFQVRRLEGGLATLAAAAETCKELSEELSIKNAVIAEKKVVVEKIIFDIQGKSEIANKKAAEASKAEAELSVKAAEIAKAKAEATEDLKAAAPALAAA